MSSPSWRYRIAGSAGAWTAAAAVITISILSTFTFSTAGNGSPSNASSNDNGGSGASYNQGGSGGAGTGGSGGASSGGGGSSVVTKAGTAGTAGTAGRSATGAGGAGGTGPASNYDCTKGQNAGNSDEGVTGNSIAFAATVVQTGIAKDFLQDAEFAMEAARQKQNRAGGICGRQITIHYVDDGWDPTTGEQDIQSFISSGHYFGLAVNPSSEGLRGAIDSKILDQNSFPAVGTDGMLLDQYTDPWVWPVATSTHSVMHIMAQDAYARGARTFGIVWDQNYRFGKEGDLAFEAEVKRLGGSMAQSMPVTSGGDYRTQANQFVQGCSTSGTTDLAKCDFVALLLEPNTAATWINTDGGLGDGTHQPKYGVGAPQPLFLTSFAQSCQKYCATLRVWTSFNPPIAPYGSDPNVQTYVNDLHSASSSADPANPENEGAYVGMALLVQALQQLGPAPTRSALQQVLDSTSNFAMAGLAPPISYKAAVPDFADTCAQAFNAIYNGNQFTGWRYYSSNPGAYQCDNEVSQDLPG